MSLLTPPQIPLFRITLFYGPEAVAGASNTIHCVFNVKKRSWKGGVQVGIQLTRSQLEKINQRFNYYSWIEDIVQVVPGEERQNYQQKAEDLLTQLICFYKLQEYIHQGIQQENVQVSPEQLFEETQEVVFREMEEVKRQILVELDIVDGFDASHASEA